jgi:anaphase-promoting complex subunit 3
MIYFRQEKYDLAEKHFHKAACINPASPVLLCYLGMALQAQKKSAKALEMLHRVCV